MQSLIKEFESDRDLTKTLFNNFGKVIVFVFYASWNQHSINFVKNFKDTIQVFGEYPNVKYFLINAQTCPQVFKKYQVEYTPTVVFTQTDKKILKKFESTGQNSSSQSVDVGNIFGQLQTVCQQHQEDFEKDRQIWHPKIQSILDSCPIIVFIKGTPQNPKCGFTSQFLQILKQLNAEYSYYDIISDQYMRYWLRQYKGWPTYPQIFVKGKLVGGLEKVKEMQANGGEFAKLIPESCKKTQGQQKYNEMIKEQNVIVFMDGFSFENQNSKNLLAKAVEKYGQENVNMVNAAMDQKLKEYLLKSVNKGFPFVIQKGSIVEL